MIQDLRFKIKEKGFALIELVVVLALFVVIMDVTVSIFVSVVRQQKSALAEQEFVDQASYVFEYTAKALRTAVTDSNGVCLTDGSTSYPGQVYLLTHYNSASNFYAGVKFLAADGICQEFFLSDEGILQTAENGGTPQNLLSGNLPIAYARFIINGDKSLQTAGNNGVQPRMTFALDVNNQSAGGSGEKILQTTVSQRNLNAP